MNDLTLAAACARHARGATRSLYSAGQSCPPAYAGDPLRPTMLPLAYGRRRFGSPAPFTAPGRAYTPGRNWGADRRHGGHQIAPKGAERTR